jgi:hypothetical protein
MKHTQNRQLDEIFPLCRSIIGSERWSSIATCFAEIPDLESFQQKLLQTGGLPGFLPELARLEWSINETSGGNSDVPLEVDWISINPTLKLLSLSWKNLTLLLNEGKVVSPPLPEPGEELVLIWKEPGTGKTKIHPASNDDLLALKIVVDDVEPSQIAHENMVAVGLLDAAVDRAVRNGILLAPKSLIKRDTPLFLSEETVSENFLSSYSFTLQWHITQACDLHCKHCYDRSARSPMTLNQGIRILSDLYTFCRDKT